MNPHSEQLRVVAAGQLETLARALESVEPDALRRPCPGREKLGDGTVGALAAHTVDNYGRIAAFLHGAGPAAHGGGPGMHGHRPTGGVTLDDLRARLTRASGLAGALAGLSEERLAEVPAEGSFRFCDGARTLEQVLTGLLTHQEHQVAAIAAALG